MTRADLIAALEKAEGPSRELDAEIRKHVPGDYLPAFTASLDAALTLVPDSATWTVFEIDPPEPSTPYGALVGRRPSYGPLAVRRFRGDGATPALALSIAALKARE